MKNFAFGFLLALALVVTMAATKESPRLLINGYPVRELRSGSGITFSCWTEHKNEPENCIISAEGK